MKRYFKTTIAAAVVLTLVAVFVVQSYVKRKIKGGQKATAVRIEVIEPAQLVEFVTAPGMIEPMTKVDISAKVSARLVELPFEEGRRVTKAIPTPSRPYRLRC